MDTDDTSDRQKIPVAIHFAALFYIIQALIILSVFFDTRKKESPALITVDIITLLLLLIPLVALWSIYKPGRYLRWFPLYGIVFNWVVVIGIGRDMLHIIWLDAIGSEDTGVVGGMLTLSFLVVVTLWMLLPLRTVIDLPSARAYITRGWGEIKKWIIVLINMICYSLIMLIAIYATIIIINANR